jgi:HK97 family phage portal protein
MWPFPKKALTGAPAVLDALRDQGWAPFPLLGGGSRQRIQDAYNTAQSAGYAWIYTNSPAVRTVVDTIVRNVGQLDLRLYEEVDETERQPKPDHPAALSLRYPNEDTAADSFIRSLFTDYLTFDNAYALILPASGRQLTFEHLPAGSIEIRGSSLFRAEGYRYWRRDGTWIDFQPAQILHWKGENPHDPRIGLSLLDTLRDVIAEDSALRQATVELAQAGLQEPAWVFRPLEAPEWSNEARKGFEEDLTNRLRRRNKMPVVLEEGMEMRSFGVSPKDAEMMSVRRWAIERVASLYGVPLGMVGLDDNLEQAQKQFYADCLPPYCEEFTKFLNQRILVRVYNWTDGCFEFNLDEKHMGDDRLAALVSATGRPVLLTNEARAKLNQPPVPGGDELVTPMNVTVGDNPKPSVDIMPIQDPNKPPQDGSYREQPKMLPQRNGKGHELERQALAKAVDDPTAQSHEDFVQIPQIHPGFKRDLEIQHQAVDLAKATIERHFNRLERSMRQKAGEADWDRWDRDLASDISKTVRAIVGEEGTRYAFKLTGEFDMAKVKNYLRAMAEGAAEAINDTIRQEIDDLGFEDAMAKRSQHVASAGAGLGAGATRWAREEAARQSPGTEHRVKTWIPNTQRHAEFAGDTVPLGDDWPAGFAPGSAPGCGCTVAIS